MFVLTLVLNLRYVRDHNALINLPGNCHVVAVELTCDNYAKHQDDPRGQNCSDNMSHCFSFLLYLIKLKMNKLLI
jgi:hypothetical protein